MNETSITRAESADLAACVALLPPVAFHDTAFAVARGADGMLLGAAGMAWRGRGDPAGFPVWVHVFEDARRRGIGRRLTDAVAREARGEARFLWAAQALDLEDGASCFARAVGFGCTQRQFHFRADARRFLTAVAPMVTRLTARGRIPATAHLLPLDHAHADAVVALVGGEVPTAPPDLRAQVTRSFAGDPSSAPIDRTRSRVLLLDGQVAGALLSQRLADGVNSRIVANAVAPRLRRGWANALLLEATTRAGIEDGAGWFAFDCAEDVTDTIGLARRGEAELVRTTGLFRQAIARSA